MKSTRYTCRNNLYQAIRDVYNLCCYDACLWENEEWQTLLCNRGFHHEDHHSIEHGYSIQFQLYRNRGFANLPMALNLHVQMYICAVCINCIYILWYLVTAVLVAEVVKMDFCKIEKLLFQIVIIWILDYTTTPNCSQQSFC